MRVLVSDDLSAEGVELFRRQPGMEVDVKVGLKPEELKAIIGGYDALVVRSATKVTADILSAASKLRVIGRAGSGVDNIDVPAATRRGIVVMNTPGGNTVTVAELAVGLMLALARQIPQASAVTRAGKWDKKKFAHGRELLGKTVGLVGAGNIGGVVAQRCRAFGMKVIAFDPFLTPEAAARLGVELATLDQVTEQADIVSLHTPLTEQTKNMFDAARLARMKKGAYLINCARGGLVDEMALAGALKEGRLGGAALDVFAKEPPAADHPLFACENFICTPHLGASTDEAQNTVAVAVAEQMVDFLKTGTVRNAVNAPSVSGEMLELLGPWLLLARKLGALAGQLRPETVDEVEIELVGDFPTGAQQPLGAVVLRGLLAGQVEGEVNEVNAPELARERGLKVVTKRSTEVREFATVLTIVLRGKGVERRVAGTLFGRRQPRIVQIDHYSIDAAPEGNLLAVRSVDVPGVIGAVGTVLGKGGVNIAAFHLGRGRPGGDAFALVTVDAPAPAPVLAQLRALPNVNEVVPLQLP